MKKMETEETLKIKMDTINIVKLKDENMRLHQSLAKLEKKFQVEMTKKDQEIAILKRQLKRMVDNIQRFTSSMVLEISDADVTPSGADVTPYDADVTPSDADVTPYDADVTPSDADVTPSDADVTPSGADVTPSDADVTPSDADVTPSAASDNKICQPEPEKDDALSARNHLLKRDRVYERYRSQNNVDCDLELQQRTCAETSTIGTGRGQLADPININQFKSRKDTTLQEKVSSTYMSTENTSVIKNDVNNMKEKSHRSDVNIDPSKLNSLNSCTFDSVSSSSYSQGSHLVCTNAMPNERMDLLTVSGEHTPKDDNRANFEVSYVKDIDKSLEDQVNYKNSSNDRVMVSCCEENIRDSSRLTSTDTREVFNVDKKDKFSVKGQEKINNSESIPYTCMKNNTTDVNTEPKNIANEAKKPIHHSDDLDFSVDADTSKEMVIDEGPKNDLSSCGLVNSEESVENLNKVDSSVDEFIEVDNTVINHDSTDSGKCDNTENNSLVKICEKEMNVMKTNSESFDTDNVKLSVDIKILSSDIELESDDEIALATKKLESSHSHKEKTRKTKPGSDSSKVEVMSGQSSLIDESPMISDTNKSQYVMCKADQNSHRKICNSEPCDKSEFKKCDCHTAVVLNSEIVKNDKINVFQNNTAAGAFVHVKEVKSLQNKDDDNSRTTDMGLPNFFGKRKRKSSSHEHAGQKQPDNASNVKKPCLDIQNKLKGVEKITEESTVKPEAKMTIIDKATKHFGNYFYQSRAVKSRINLQQTTQERLLSQVKNYVSIAQKKIVGGKIKMKESYQIQKCILDAREKGHYLDDIDKTMKISAKMSEDRNTAVVVPEDVMGGEEMEDLKVIQNAESQKEKEVSGSSASDDTVKHGHKVKKPPSTPFCVPTNVLTSNNNENVTSDNKKVVSDKEEEVQMFVEEKNKRAKKNSTLRFDPSVIDRGLSSFITNMTGSVPSSIEYTSKKIVSAPKSEEKGDGKISESGMESVSIKMHAAVELTSNRGLNQGLLSCQGNSQGNLKREEGQKEQQLLNSGDKESVMGKLTEAKPGKLSLSQYKERKHKKSDVHYDNAIRKEDLNVKKNKKVSNDLLHTVKIIPLDSNKTENQNSTAEDVLKLLGVPRSDKVQLIQKTQDSIGNLLSQLNLPCSKDKDDSLNKAAMLENNVTHLLDSLVNVQNLCLKRSSIESPVKQQRCSLQNTQRYSKNLSSSFNEDKSTCKPRDPRKKPQSKFVNPNNVLEVDRQGKVTSKRKTRFDPPGDISSPRIESNIHSPVVNFVPNTMAQPPTTIAGNYMRMNHNCFQLMNENEKNEPEMPAALMKIMSDYENFTEGLLTDDNQTSDDIKKEYNETMEYLSVLQNQNPFDENLRIGANAVHEMMIVKLARALEKEAMQTEGMKTNELQGQRMVQKEFAKPAMNRYQKSCKDVFENTSTNKSTEVKVIPLNKVSCKVNVHKALLQDAKSPKKKLSVEAVTNEVSETQDSVLWSMALDETETTSADSKEHILMDESRDSLYGDISETSLNVSAMDTSGFNFADSVQQSCVQSEDRDVDDTCDGSVNKLESKNHSEEIHTKMNKIGSSPDLITQGEGTKTHKETENPTLNISGALVNEVLKNKTEMVSPEKSNSLFTSTSVSSDKPQVETNEYSGLKNQELAVNGRLDDQSHGHSLLDHDLYLSDASCSMSIAEPVLSTVNNSKTDDVVEKIDENDNNVDYQDKKNNGDKEESKSENTINETKEFLVSDTKNRLPMFSPLKNFKALLSPAKLQSAMYSPSSKGSSKMDENDVCNDFKSENGEINFRLKFDKEGMLNKSFGEACVDSDVLQSKNVNHENNPNSINDVVTDTIDANNLKPIANTKVDEKVDVKENCDLQEAISLLPGDETFDGHSKTDYVDIATGAFGDFDNTSHSYKNQSSMDKHTNMSNESEHENSFDSNHSIKNDASPGVDEDNSVKEEDDSKEDDADSAEEGEILDSDDDSAKQPEEKENIQVQSNIDLRDKLKKKTADDSRNKKKDPRQRGSKDRKVLDRERRYDKERRRSAEHSRPKDRRDQRQPVRKSSEHGNRDHADRNRRSNKDNRDRSFGQSPYRRVNDKSVRSHRSPSRGGGKDDHRHKNSGPHERSNTRTRTPSNSARHNDRGHTRKEGDRRSGRTVSEKDNERTPIKKGAEKSGKVPSDTTPSRGTKRRRSSSHEKTRKR